MHVLTVSASPSSVAQSAAAAPRAIWQRQYVTWVIVSDAAVVTASMFASQVLRFGHEEGRTVVVDSLISVAIVVGWVSALSIARTRARSVLGDGTEEYRRVWSATMFVFLTLAVVSSLVRVDISRGYLAIALPLGLIGLTINRHLARRGVAAQRRRGRFCHRVLAVGQPASVEQFMSSLAKRQDGGYLFVGSCSPALARQRDHAAQANRIRRDDEPESEFAQTMRRTNADTVALVSGDLTPDELRDLSWELKRLDVDLVVSPGVVDIAQPRLAFRANGGLPLIHVDKPQYDGAKRFEKRAFDVCFAVLALALSAPLLVLTAIAIKMTGPGPVFYRSERIGLDGRPFQMIKFRTMVAGADQMMASLAHLNDGNGVLFKIRADPRVTPVGHQLRRFSLDELPQFLNVLRGDMSVVGPRPPLAREVDSYDEQVRRRLLVRPGITGLWQVSGRSDLSWEDSVRLDLSYVENWSMIGDIAIAVSTARVVLTGRGAY